VCVCVCVCLCVCVICYRAQDIVEDSIGIVKESFDNNLTPYYALAVSIWGPYMRVCLCLCTRHLHRKDSLWNKRSP